MEDSALSVAANIAGLLTFAAAVLAFVYVRYENLNKGYVELALVLNSLRNKTSDLEGMSISERIIVTPGDGVETIWLKKLLTSIVATEVVITAYLVYVQDLGPPSGIKYISRFELLIPLVSGVEPMTYEDAIDEAKTAIARQRFLTSDNIAGRSLQFALKVGTTPRLVRWYRVRTKVLERIRERQDLQSRLLSHQIDMANSSARRSHEALETLRKQQEEVKEQLEELTRQVVKASGAPAPADGVNDGGDTEEIQATLLSIQPEVAQSSPGVEINSG